MSSLAERLVGDLTEAGYDVWRDKDRMLGGRDWDIQLADAIRNADLLLALLSPHAVRSSTLHDPRGDDGVCLDEIATARFSSPRVPILPVLTAPCSPPFLIQRLHYLDGTRYQENSVYASLLQQIITEAERLLKGEPERTRLERLHQLSFATYIGEKTSAFVGREWLLQDLIAFLADPAAPKTLLIVGPPGIGKSAVAARLVQRNPNGCLVAHHFCRSDIPETLDPLSVVKHLCGMLSLQIPAFAIALDNALRLDGEKPAADAIGFADRYLVQILRSVPTPGDTKAILIDALDEGIKIAADVDVAKVASFIARKLPPWLRLIVTSRPDQDIIQNLSFVKPKIIRADDSRNLDDVRKYLSEKVEQTPEFNKS